HERYDGTGYPSGLKGDEIPEEARIIAVADAYDAMSSDRNFRTRLPRAEIIDELKNGMGTQFDPEYAQIMLEIIEEDKDYRLKG
ncbi:MAG: HD-GYP domain protein, partial [Clostridiales bacterium]|nr:HD-GYP domain protein [Clostridiales bacterium]